MMVMTASGTPAMNVTKQVMLRKNAANALDQVYMMILENIVMYVKVQVGMATDGPRF